MTDVDITVLWVSGNLIDDYDIARHLMNATKFLWMPRCKLLVCGPYDAHDELLTALRLAIQEDLRFRFPGRGDVEAAGDMLNGRIISWESVGFGVETPEELRPAIMGLFGISDSS